jgi:LPXTG-motif cell wall-anchored protein
VTAKTGSTTSTASPQPGVGPGDPGAPPPPPAGGVSGTYDLPYTGDDHTGDLVALAVALVAAGAAAIAGARARRLAEQTSVQRDE